ncbi:MAG: hypothetical protein ABW252_13090 [Polyangiales bacterium]
MLFWLVLWPLSPEAHAQTQAPVQVRWRLPTACPRPARLESDLAAMLGARLESARPLLADVDVQTSAPQQYDLTLRVEGASGRAERSLALHSCAEVERAVVLLVTTALQMDALGTSDVGASEVATASSMEAREPRDVQPPPEVEPPPETLPPRAAVRAPEEVAPLTPRRPPSFWLRLGAAVDVAALPGVTVGPFAGVGLHLRPFRIWLDGRYFLPRERTDPGSSQPAEIGLFTGAVGGAYALTMGAVTFGPAAEIELGVLRARVLGEFADGSVRTAWAALMGGAHAEVAVRSGVALALDAFLGLPLRRPGFVVADQAAFYRTSTLTARFALGVRVHLGP